MSYVSVSINHLKCRCYLEAKNFTCYKENNRDKRFYGCANFISKEAGSDFFSGFQKTKT